MAQDQVVIRDKLFYICGPGECNTGLNVEPVHIVGLRLTFHVSTSGCDTCRTILYFFNTFFSKYHLYCTKCIGVSCTSFKNNLHPSRCNSISVVAVCPDLGAFRTAYMENKLLDILLKAKINLFTCYKNEDAQI